MRLRRAGGATLLLVGVLGASPSPAAAQARYTLTLPRYTEVRIVTAEPRSRRMRGVARGIARDSLHFMEPIRDGRRVVALADLESLEVRGGIARRRGMLIGALAGVAVGLMMGPEERASVTTGMALIGTAVGYAFAPKGWEPLPLPVR